MADHARLQHVLDGERLLLPGGGIELRPLARRDRDLGEVLARGAVLMHVARGRERIGAGRQERLERRLVRIDLALRGLLAPDAALGRAVGDHRDIAQPGFDRGRRLRDVKLERRAAGHRGADEFRRDAEILDQRDDRHALLRHGAEQAVDILQREPAIGERAQRALRAQVHRAHAVGDLAEIGFGDADDRRRAALQAFHHAASGVNTGIGGFLAARTDARGISPACRSSRARARCPRRGSSGGSPRRSRSAPR